MRFSRLSEGEIDLILYARCQTASWGHTGGLSWFSGKGSKTHAFFHGIYLGGGLEQTICGVDFMSECDWGGCQRAAHGCFTDRGYYMAHIGENLADVDCEHCLRALLKVEEVREREHGA